MMSDASVVSEASTQPQVVGNDWAIAGQAESFSSAEGMLKQLCPADGSHYIKVGGNYSTLDAHKVLPMKCTHFRRGCKAQARMVHLKQPAAAEEAIRVEILGEHDHEHIHETTRGIKRKYLSPLKTQVPALVPIVCAWHVQQSILKYIIKKTRTMIRCEWFKVRPTTNT